MTASPEPYERLALTTVRVIDAPPGQVWKAWTDPARMARWWGPSGFTNPVCEMDVWPGGLIWIIMRDAGGTDHPMSGRFREVVEPSRLVFVGTPQDAIGKPYADNVVTVTIEAEPGGKTRLTVHSDATAFTRPGTGMLDFMEEGWNQSLARLAALED